MALKKLKVTVEPKLLRTYLAMIEASEGASLFQKFYASVNGRVTDILGNGNLSCSFYVTSILKLFNLVQEVQVTKFRAVRDMTQSGWYTISRPKRGCIVAYAAKPADPRRMKHDAGIYQSQVEHLAFYLGKGEAISHGGDTFKSPERHPLKYRPVTAYYWHDALDHAFTNPEKASPKHKPGIYWKPNTT